jgi:hypothetical protein
MTGCRGSSHQIESLLVGEYGSVPSRRTHKHLNYLEYPIILISYLGVSIVPSDSGEPAAGAFPKISKVFKSSHARFA